MALALTGGRLSSTRQGVEGSINQRGDHFPAKVATRPWLR